MIVDPAERHRSCRNMLGLLSGVGFGLLAWFALVAVAVATLGLAR